MEINVPILLNNMLSSDTEEAKTVQDRHFEASDSRESRVNVKGIPITTQSVQSSLLFRCLFLGDGVGSSAWWFIRHGGVSPFLHRPRPAETTRAPHENRALVVEDVFARGFVLGSLRSDYDTGIAFVDHIEEGGIRH